MALAQEGLYVVANSKIVLLKDTDADGRADREDVVVTDWPKDDGVTGGGVDAVGIAIDRENNLFFGLGCANFANPLPHAPTARPITISRANAAPS